MKRFRAVLGCSGGRASVVAATPVALMIPIVIVVILAGVTLGGCEKNNSVTSPPDSPADSTGEGGGGGVVPDSLAIARAFPPILANGVDETEVRAIVVDQRGRRIPGVGVAFETDHGTITPFATTDGQGIASATLRGEASPSDLVANVRAHASNDTIETGYGKAAGMGGDSESVRVVLGGPRLSRRLVEGAIAADAAGGEISDTVRIPMLGITLSLRASPGTIPADGISASRIVATLIETTRRVPLQGEDVRFGADHGEISGSARTDELGNAIATLTAAAGDTGATVNAWYGPSLAAATHVSFSQLFLRVSSDADTIIADGISSAVISARLTSIAGNPVAGARIDFGTTAGRISPSAETDRDGAAVARLTSGVEAATALVTVRFGGAVIATLETVFVTPPSTGVVLLSVHPGTLPADGSSQAVLRATVLDARSNPMPDGTPVTFRVVSGGGRIIQPTRTTVEGVAEGTYAAGNAAGLVTIDAASGTAVATATLVLGSLDASLVVCESEESSIKADGSAFTVVTATVTDAFRHPVGLGTVVSFTTTLGILDLPTPTDTNGRATIRLRSTPKTTGTAHVAARVGESLGMVNIEFVSEDAAHIIAVAVDPPSIGVLGAGDPETSTLTFEVVDSNGIPVDSAHAVDAVFSIFPQGGATDALVHPLTARTDARGIVVTHVNSGVISGTVLVSATSGALGSRPIRVAIHGGLPDPDHFSISFEKVNIAGLVYDGIRNPVTARIGDIHGNPVPESTVVWFESAFGLVQGSAGTNDHGEATVDEVTAGPRPSIPGGDGLVQICGRTVSRLDGTITACGNVMWSGPTIIAIDDAVDGFDLPNAGSIAIAFRVRDANGNPLVGGTSITVAATGGRLGGDVGITLPDTQSQSYTYFSVVLSDADVETDLAEPVTVTVTVASENGGRSASVNGTIH
jgi:hypothetical protein